MSKKVESLTQHQVNQLAVHRDEWIKIGLSCEPCDFEASKIAATKCYEAAGLAPPKLWFVFDSPFSAAIGVEILKKMPLGDQVWDQVRAQVWDQVRAQVQDQVRAQVWDQVWDQVWYQVRDQVRAQVQDQVRAQVWDQVRDQVRAQVWDQVWAQVRAQVWDQVWDQVRAKVWDQVRDQVRAQVWDQVRDQVWDQVGDQVWDQVGAQVRAQVRAQVWDQVWDQVGDQVFGSHDAGWLSFYSFFRDKCELKSETEKLTGLINLANSCGWWTPYSGACIFQHRHSELHRDTNGRLHSESGMACRYRDGFGVWAINGIRVDEQIVLRPETQTIKQIDAEENGDIRAIRIVRYGWANYLRDSASKCVDFRDNEIEGTKEALYVTPKQETRLVATCATGRVMVMGVPSQIKTCRSAQEWLAGNRHFRIVGRT